MNKRIKAEWIKALTSGEYKKAKGALHKNGRFCCLGVLLDACVEGDWIYQEEKTSWAFRAEDEQLPKEIREKFGISYHDEIILADLNDNDGASFKTIAKWISNNL